MAKFQGFQKKQLLDIYRNMILARKLDDRESMQALSGAERYIHQTRIKQDLGILKAGWDKAALMIDSRLQPSSDETR